MWLFLVFVLRDIISNFNVYKKNGKDINVMKNENKPHYIFLVFTYEAFRWSEDFDIVLEAYNTRSKETIIRMFS